MNGESYRTSHASTKAALWYDQIVYAPGSFDSWLWEREKQELLILIERYLRAPSACRYLDFACGTGRLLQLLERRFGESTGVDVSAQMLAIAQSRLDRSTLLLGDLTLDSSLLRGPFDLITAFRFLLNAEPLLQHAALAALRERLTQSGFLIVSVHGNAWSLRAVSATARRHLLRQRNVNQMSPKGLRRLLSDEGFELEEMVGFGVLPPQLFRALGPRIADSVSRWFEGSRHLRMNCIDLIAVARKGPCPHATGSLS